MPTRNQNLIVGMDIGGANLKYSTVTKMPLEPPEPTDLGTGAGFIPKSKSWSTTFPMWTDHQRLCEQLVSDLESLDASKVEACAVTMTGELADCFFDRAQGVAHIIQHVQTACQRLGFPEARFYGVDGSFRQANECAGNEMILAASNWHALANNLSQVINSEAILIDVGSTTTDIIPLCPGKIETDAQTDFDRLREGSLVYLGGERTSVATVISSLHFRGDKVPVVREHFATMVDVRLILGFLQPCEQDCDTADGQPKTRRHAINRLARLLGLSFHEVSSQEADGLAEQIHTVARQRLEASVLRLRAVRDASPLYILSGHNDDLITLAEGQDVLRIREVLGQEASRAAPAVAVACLLRKKINEENPR